MIREDLVRRKISLIQDELVHLEPFKNFTLDEIAKDYVKQAALERILERIIVRAIDINNHLITALALKDTSPPKDYRETFFCLADLKIYPVEFGKEISKSVGTRNILAHEYDEVDYQKIYGSINDCLRDYHQYCQYILDFLDAQIRKM
ncbi:MAG: DUF86 domain-containing protein [Patescibacteria group bacterium]